MKPDPGWFYGDLAAYDLSGASDEATRRRKAVERQPVPGIRCRRAHACRHDEICPIGANVCQRKA
jgi:hypothetical protein